VALIVIRGENDRSGKVENTSRVQETSDENVVIVKSLSSEHNTALSLIATIIIHSDTVVDITGGFIARLEDENDGIQCGTIITSLKNNSLALTTVVIPHTARLIFVGAALDASVVTSTSISLVKFTHFEFYTIIASSANSASKGNCGEQAQS